MKPYELFLLRVDGESFEIESTDNKEHHHFNTLEQLSHYLKRYITSNLSDEPSDYSTKGVF